MRHTVLIVSAALAFAACNADPDKPQLAENIVGHCDYVSAFTGDPECKEYLGTWTDEAAEADCTRLESTFVAGEACPAYDLLGYCLKAGDEGDDFRLHVIGDDPADCGFAENGCEFFGGGYFDPAPVCADGNPGLVVTDPFPMPELVCRQPLEGEPEGQSEGGEVCTWQMISGATEEGRVYSDYASCEPVRKQRPYSPVPGNARYGEPDPRMDDPDYAAEVEWVRSQLRSSACICCHDQSAPSGPSVFDLDAEGNFANQFNDRGVAMGAGWINTVSFGAFPPEQNNGFVRANPDHPEWSIVPTTDMERMLAFWKGEAEHRGIEQADFADVVYGTNPLDALLSYEPGPCSAEEGLFADGTLSWLPGRARFVYVLEQGSQTPTVPPNLDTPEGTIWKLSARAGELGLPAGELRYGEVPPGMRQEVPASGPPPELESGTTYYLVASADVVFPISRCEFVAP